MAVQPVPLAVICAASLRPSSSLAATKPLAPGASVTRALAKSMSSRSISNRSGASTRAPSSSVYLKFVGRAVAVAASATAVIASARVAAALVRPSASVTVHCSVRAALSAVGSWLVLLKLTLRSAVRQSATLALPVSVSTPVSALKLPLMPACVLKFSRSPSLKPALIATLAALKLALSSLSVSPASIATAAASSV